MRRLLVYCGCLLAILAGLEALLRWQHPLFLGASHRASFKAAAYVARGGAEVVFYGSSRTADGILPAYVGGETFNLAISRTSMDVLEWLASNTPAPKRLAIVEVSEPQNVLRAPEWLPHKAGDDPESELEYALSTHLDLLGLRRVFRYDGLARLAATAFASSFDGSEISAADFVRAVTKERDHPPTGTQRPFVRREVAPGAGTHPMAERYLAVAKQLKRVIFYVPPMLRADPPSQPLLEALAHAAPVWDLSASQAPPEWFRDPDHLNTQGAAELSAAFADWLAHAL